jgi:hypothetical protein
MSRLARTAKGRKPRYFADPATDKLLDMVVKLTAELSVTRDRLDAIETLIARHGVLPAGAVEAFEPTEAEAKARHTARRALIARVLQVIEDEASEAAAVDAPQSIDALVEELARD